MLRTSIYLPEDLYERVRLRSKQRKTSVSVAIRHLVDKGLQPTENDQLTKVYTGLDSLWGSGNPRVTDASTTVDETLYGDHGAWRGHSD